MPDLLQDILLRLGVKVTGEAAVKSLDSTIGRFAQSQMTTIQKLNQFIETTTSRMQLAFGTYAASATAIIGMSSQVASRNEVLDGIMKQVAKNTGTATTALDEQRKIMIKQGITTKEATQALVTFMQSNIDVAYSARLSRAAQDLAVIAGMNSSEAYGVLANTVASLNVINLRQFGIVKDLNEILKEEARRIRTTTDAMTDQQKKQAVLNYILKESVNAAGTYEESMGKVGKLINSLPRLYEEAANQIGQVFLPFWYKQVEGTVKILEAFNKLDPQLIKIISILGAVGVGFATLGVILIGVEKHFGGILLSAAKLWGLFEMFQNIGFAFALFKQLDIGIIKLTATLGSFTTIVKALPGFFVDIAKIGSASIGKLGLWMTELGGVAGKIGSLIVAGTTGFMGLLMAKGADIEKFLAKISLPFATFFGKIMKMGVQTLAWVTPLEGGLGKIATTVITAVGGNAAKATASLTLMGKAGALATGGLIGSLKLLGMTLGAITIGAGKLALTLGKFLIFNWVSIGIIAFQQTQDMIERWRQAEEDLGKEIKKVADLEHEGWVNIRRWNEEWKKMSTEKLIEFGVETKNLVEAQQALLTIMEKISEKHKKPYRERIEVLEAEKKALTSFTRINEFTGAEETHIIAEKNLPEKTRDRLKEINKELVLQRALMNVLTVEEQKRYDATSKEHKELKKRTIEKATLQREERERAKKLLEAYSGGNEKNLIKVLQDHNKDWDKTIEKSMAYKNKLDEALKAAKTLQKTEEQMSKIKDEQFKVAEKLSNLQDKGAKKEYDRRLKEVERKHKFGGSEEQYIADLKLLKKMFFDYESIVEDAENKIANAKENRDEKERARKIKKRFEEISYAKSMGKITIDQAIEMYKGMDKILKMDESDREKRDAEIRSLNIEKNKKAKEDAKKSNAEQLAILKDSMQTFAHEYETGGKKIEDLRDKLNIARGALLNPLVLADPKEMRDWKNKIRNFEGWIDEEQRKLDTMTREKDYERQVKRDQWSLEEHKDYVKKMLEITKVIPLEYAKWLIVMEELEKRSNEKKLEMWIETYEILKKELERDTDNRMHSAKLNMAIEDMLLKNTKMAFTLKEHWRKVERENIQRDLEELYNLEKKMQEDSFSSFMRNLEIKQSAYGDDYKRQIQEVDALLKAIGLTEEERVKLIERRSQLEKQYRNKQKSDYEKFYEELFQMNATEAQKMKLEYDKQARDYQKLVESGAISKVDFDQWSLQKQSELYEKYAGSVVQANKDIKQSYEDVKKTYLRFDIAYELGDMSKKAEATAEDEQQKMKQKDWKRFFGFKPRGIGVSEKESWAREAEKQIRRPMGGDSFIPGYIGLPSDFIRRSEEAGRLGDAWTSTHDPLTRQHPLFNNDMINKIKLPKINFKKDALFGAGYSGQKTQPFTQTVYQFNGVTLQPSSKTAAGFSALADAAKSAANIPRTARSAD